MSEQTANPELATATGETAEPPPAPPAGGPHPEPSRIAFAGKEYSTPFKILLPGLTTEEATRLRDNIRENGVIVPIVLTEADEILDGVHRLTLAAELGLDPGRVRFETLAGLSADEKAERVLALNVHRRHLSREQVRELIARRLRARPDDANRVIGEAVGADDKTVEHVRAGLEATAEIPQSAVRRGKGGRYRPVPSRGIPRPTARGAGRVTTPDDDWAELGRELEVDQHLAAVNPTGSPGTEGGSEVPSGWDPPVAEPAETVGPELTAGQREDLAARVEDLLGLVTAVAACADPGAAATAVAQVVASIEEIAAAAEELRRWAVALTS